MIVGSKNIYPHVRVTGNGLVSASIAESYSTTLATSKARFELCSAGSPTLVIDERESSQACFEMCLLGSFA
jgi:hypothetical protein